MASPYQIDINGGTGSSAILNGTYAVTTSVTGYNNASILPTTQTVTAGVNSYDFTIAATGTLTLRVTEDGLADGTAVVGATFKRCDSEGNEYGTVITTGTNGDAVFAYVPFAAENAPTIYYKQTGSADNHEYVKTLANTTMTTDTKQIVIQNTPAATRTINLTDVNYEGLPVDAGTITLT